jgi:hypothetical protein
MLLPAARKYLTLQVFYYMFVYLMKWMNYLNFERYTREFLKLAEKPCLPLIQMKPRVS